MANPVGFSKQFDILKLKDILEVQGSNIGSSTQSVRCFVELGGGVDDVPVWCHNGAYVEFGLR